MSADPLRVVVWRLGEATLAVPLEDVVEIARVDGEQARSRGGRLDLSTLRGLEPRAVEHAIVISAGAGSIALPADHVDGVVSTEAGAVRQPPPWLRRVTGPHVDRLIRLEDDRVAVLLSVAGVGGAA